MEKEALDLYCSRNNIYAFCNLSNLQIYFYSFNIPFILDNFPSVNRKNRRSYKLAKDLFEGLYSIANENRLSQARGEKGKYTFEL